MESIYAHSPDLFPQFLLEGIYHEHGACQQGRQGPSGSVPSLRYRLFAERAGGTEAEDVVFAMLSVGYQK